jgi:hypothetical protein
MLPHPKTNPLVSTGELQMLLTSTVIVGKPNLLVKGFQYRNIFLCCVHFDF